MNSNPTAATTVVLCPGCNTMFRAHQDQLQRKSGLVRCGQCSLVFNANNTPAVVAAANAEASDSVAVAAADLQSDSIQDLAPQANASEVALNPWQTVPVPPSRWKSFSLLLLSLLLLTGLLLQMIYHWRGDLALLFPSTQPWLQQACALVDCELPLPRLDKLVSIEDSDLQADATNPRVMVLSALIRNRAPFTQAYPSVELTLTNEQGETVTRRVLAPRDYLGKRADPEDGFDAASEMPFKLYLEAGKLPVTGYRLYLFFP